MNYLDYFNENYKNHHQLEKYTGTSFKHLMKLDSFKENTVEIISLLECILAFMFTSFSMC